MSAPAETFWNIRKGNLVRYIGHQVAMLHGREGVVVCSSDRNGWVLVDFGGGFSATKCAACNVERVQ